MDTLNWQDLLTERAKQDAWYAQWLHEVRTLEPRFYSLRSQLSEEQQELLDDYISACEILESCRTLLAYQLGREHGMAAIHYANQPSTRNKSGQ